MPVADPDRGNPSADVGRMLALNEAQADYYDHLGSSGNVVTRLWRFVRRRTQKMRALLQVTQQVLDLHRRWLGDLSGKSVLDLGAYGGNALSLELAARSGKYLAIDLSAEGIGRLRKRIEAAGLPHADARVVDFLSPDFGETFDVIYAHSVMHHFRYFDAFLGVLRGKLNPGGHVVSFDPLETDLPMRLLRRMYRPFQSDRNWEWPFNRGSFDTIRRHFVITDIQGSSGYLKWAYPLAIFSPEAAARVGRNLQRRDLQAATALGPDLYRCLQVSLRLEPIPRSV